MNTQKKEKEKALVYVPRVKKIKVHAIISDLGLYIRRFVWSGSLRDLLAHVDQMVEVY